MLELVHISKTFPNQHRPVVDLLDLTVHKGEFFSLLGPSGCGKTTLLRMIAGLDCQTSGEIHLNGKAIHHLPAQERPFNMVFQRYALFPHLTVYDNIAFGLRMKKVDPDEIERRVQDVLHLVNLNSFDHRYPETLSGGQAQRVAVARALVNQPQILLLDEPLSALDQKMRIHMQRELRDLQRRLGLTFIYVTHDQEEAFALSDRVAVMNQGAIEQLSAPAKLYDEPATLFVARFVGAMTEFGVHRWESLPAGLAKFEFAGQWFTAKIKGTDLQQPLAMIRPERIDLASGREVPPGFNQIKGVIRNVVFRGAYLDLDVEIKDGRWIRALIPPHEIERFKLGVASPIDLMFDPEDTLLFVQENP